MNLIRGSLIMNGSGVSDMARITFKNDSEYYEKLQKFEEEFIFSNEEIDKAVKKGAGVVADAVRANLQKVPTEKFHKLSQGEVFNGISESEKTDLLGSFGVTPVKRNTVGFAHAKVGFDGYGSFPTETYPGGVPNQLLAGAVEHGSSVRKKTPFIRPAIKISKDKAIEAMAKSIDESMKKIF